MGKPYPAFRQDSVLFHDLNKSLKCPSCLGTPLFRLWTKTESCLNAGYVTMCEKRITAFVYGSTIKRQSGEG